MNEALAQADYIVLHIPELGIEGDDVRVRGPHQKVQFGAASLGQKPFRLSHESAPDGLLAVRGRNCQVVHPSAVSVEPDHGCACQPPVDFTYKEQLWLLCELARDVCMWIIPRTNQTGFLPNRYDSGRIRRAESADLHVRGTLTFDVSGWGKQAKLAGERPLDGGVRRHVLDLGPSCLSKKEYSLVEGRSIGKVQEIKHPPV